MRIDLQNDPAIPAGRAFIDHLVGAHMAAQDDKELFHMVSMTINQLNQSDQPEKVKVLVHAAYYAQSLIVALLDQNTRQSIELQRHGLEEPHSNIDPAVFDERRLETWDQLKHPRFPDP